VLAFHPRVAGRGAGRLDSLGILAKETMEQFASVEQMLG
jgi:hypothetical protein